MIDFDDYVPIAVRAWTKLATKKPKKPKKPKKQQRAKTTPQRRRQLSPEDARIRHVLVFDTETTVSAEQRLLFGCCRYARVDGTQVTTVAEALIYADDLPERDPDGYAVLRGYVRSRKADVDVTYLGVEPDPELQLLSRSKFVDRWLWRVGYPHNDRNDPATIVAFNAPFDLSRIAVDVREAITDMRGGFSFIVWADEEGTPVGWKPRVAVKALDSKRSRMKFRKLERDRDNHSGFLLDLRTLVSALTGDSHSLNSACEHFGVPGKAPFSELGVISEEAIDYCRQDVKATTDLFEATWTEYQRHPINLHPTEAYSAASIAKAYLKAMGIQPRLQAQPDFPHQILGHAMSAFYGGRAEVHLRHLPVPVQVLDFTSMYPTVDTNMGIWPLVTAESIEIVDATAQVQHLLDTVTLEDCFHPGPWKDLVVIAELIPDGDMLPVRAQYGDGQDWSIGVNPVHSIPPLWYPLPDLIASKLLSGRTPSIRAAVRFLPQGQQHGLTPVALHGELMINPRIEDFFQRVVELRQEVRARVPDHQHDDCPCEDCGLSRFLKVLANSGSYGIYAEMNRQEAPGTTTAYSNTDDPYTVRVDHPETPGRYCFPPIAACITAAARLMLALLERSVTDLGGEWVFCDTDSMAIVATQTGGDLLACPGGAHRLPDGTPAIRALSHDQLRAIQKRFDTLNPYNPTLVPHVLKWEETGYCYAISAKRYAIYSYNADGTIEIIKRSEHGLGRYLDPRTPAPAAVDDADTAEENESWIDEVWRWIISSHDDPDTALPDWADKPALSRITVSSPLLARPFEEWNHDQFWADRIKPFNFLLVADLDPLGLPPGVDPQRFRLIAPYSTADGRTLEWRNLYDPSGPTYQITTDRDTPPQPHLAVVKSYAYVIRRYRLHPEHKFRGPDGHRCGPLTEGVLQRRPTYYATLRRIGKEANRLDDVRAGLIADPDEATTTYHYPAPLDWQELVWPVLARYSGRQLERLTGIDRRTIDRRRASGTPSRSVAAALTALAVQTARHDLIKCEPNGRPVDRHLRRPVSDASVLAAWYWLKGQS